jgi:Flp pilus assembly protein TadD
MTRGLIVVALVAIGCRERDHAVPSPTPPAAAAVDPLDTVRLDDRPIDWSLPVVTKTRDLSGYAGSLACKACHAPLFTTFAKHSMARTGMRPVETAGVAALFDAANDVDHVKSGFRYRPIRRGTKYFVSETLLGTDGKPIETWEEPVTHVFSAGSYGLALYSRREGRLIHLPIDYYAQAKKWDLDPMAFGGNPRMNVQLDTFCISCHSDEPAKRYDDPLPGGIGCERCHGPSKRHVATQKAEDTVGPTRLSARREVDLCTQCHQSTFEVQRPGRDHFDYRPGEPLDAFRVNFLEEPEETDRVKLLAHSERMVRSACWRGAKDKLTCTTCHDPHVSSLSEPESWWDSKCLGCHDKAACTDTPAHRQTEGDHCWHCHMGRGPASKLPLVTITDHWIQKRPAPMKPDSPDAPHSLIAWDTFVGEPVADAGAAARGYADAGLTKEAEKLAVAAVAKTPSAPLYELLANAYLARHRVSDAGRAYAAALRLDPDDSTALFGYARVMLDRGAAGEAVHAFERMLAIDPDDVAALETWGIYLERTGEHARATELFRRAAATGRASGIAYVGLANATSGDERRGWLERAWRAEPRDRWIVEQLHPHDAERLGALTQTSATAWLPRR